MKLSVLQVLAFTGVVGALGCGNHHANNPGDTNGGTIKAIKVEAPFAGAYPIKAVCTTGMIADLARQIGGPHLDVDQLFGPEVDPHTHKATTAEISRVNQADVIFYNGLHLEGKMGEVFERRSKKTPAFAVAELLPPKKVLEDEDKAHDPHVWFDVSLWSEAAGVVREALTQFDPSHAADYAKAAERYQAELAKLHAYATEQIGGIQPRERRVLITSHDAFQYFGRAYKIEVKGIQGISTDAEPSVKDITDLVAFITNRKVPAVFVETTVNKAAMKALIEGCAARGHKVTIGGELFSDAMGKEGTLEGTYVGMIRHNVDAIVRGLKGR